jgi:putative membrane protein
VRGAIGGLLMGLANLVPGISGGTMLLAVGIYPHFINGIAEISTLRFRPKTVLILTCIVGAALVAILAFAGLISGLVVQQRWVMYSLFIGLTLGGVPLLWRMVRPADPIVVLMAAFGVAVMAAVAVISPGEGGQGVGATHSYFMYFVGGLAGASAMVLPGISGGYLLLVLGQYVDILTAVSPFKEGLSTVNLPLITQAVRVLLPVGVGVVVGVVGVSNLIKLLLQRFERATLAVLLGLLLGAVIGLWPFQHGVSPSEGSVFRGDMVVLLDGQPAMKSTGQIIRPKDFRTAFFTPTAGQIMWSVAVIAAGFAISTGVARLGSAERQ